MARNELYQIHKTTDRKTGKISYLAQKFDMDYTPKGAYEISAIPGRDNKLQLECTCFASNKPVCRHRTMVLLFEETDRLNGGWYYDFDREKWHCPGQKADFGLM